MTPQEVFDTVVAHLRQQGCKAQSNGSCVYRADDGLKCAVGCLIEDQEYNSGMEHVGGINDLLASRVCPTSLKDRLTPHASLLQRLQSTHDGYGSEKWEERFARTAEDFHLHYTPKS